MVKNTAKYLIGVFIMFFVVINAIILLSVESISNTEEVLSAISDFTVDPNEPLKLHTYVLSIFSHQNIIHLFVNSVVFYSFGKVVEKVYGSKVMLFTFFASGIISAVAYVAIFSLGVLPVASSVGALGASGAIAGIIGLLTVRQFKYDRHSDESTILLFFVIPVKIHVGMAIFFILSVLAVVIGGIGFLNIAHLVHIFGLLTGVGIGYYISYVKDVKTIRPETPYAFINEQKLGIFTENKTDSIKLKYKDGNEEYKIEEYEEESNPPIAYDKDGYKRYDYQYEYELDMDILEEIYDSLNDADSNIYVVTDDEKINVELLNRVDN